MIVAIPTEDNSSFNSPISYDFRKFSFLTMVETVSGQVYSIENRGRYSGKIQGPPTVLDKLPINVVICANLEQNAGA